MAELAGKSGDVTVGGTPIGDVKSWTLDYVVDALETTDMDNDGIRAYIPGCSGWSGSVEVNKDGAPESIGTEIALVLKESDTANQDWTGQAIITGISANVAFDAVVGYTYSFQGTGALTPASA